MIRTATEYRLMWCPACKAGQSTPLATCEDCGATLQAQGQPVEDKDERMREREQAHYDAMQF